jgi:hypothetical protein
MVIVNDSWTLATYGFWFAVLAVGLTTALTVAKAARPALPRANTRKPTRPAQLYTYN